MQSGIFILLVTVFLFACSQQPAAKKLLPKTVKQMTINEAKTFYTECTKYSSVTDPRVPYSPDDCMALDMKIRAAAKDASWAEASRYKPHPVGQPLLH